MKDIAKQAERLRMAALQRYHVLDTPPEEPFDRITRLAKTVLQMPVALISLVDRDRQWFKSSQGVNFCQTARDVSFCTHTIATEAPLIVPDALADPRFCDLPLVTDDPHIRSYFGVPLRTPEGYKIGALCVMDIKTNTPSAEQVGILEDLARLVMDEMELRLVATTDSLTAALSRRGFIESATRDIARARRHGEELSCALIDIDHFKRVNDTRGHAAGDQALQQLVAMIKGNLRREDYLGRIGGEEFALMMPMTGRGQAYDVGDRLRRRVMNNRFSAGGELLSLTISLGIANLLEEDTGIEEVLARADAALYAAKAAGRNRSVAHKPQSLPAA